MTATNIKTAFEDAQSVNAFGIPDMTLIDNGRRPAVPMPSDLFGPAWEIIEQVADATSTAPDYAALGYLAAAASLVGGKRRISPYGTDWSEPLILWCAALGDPSSRKSAPLDMMTKPLASIQEMAREDFDAKKREWQADCERARAERSKWQEEVKAAAGTEQTTPDLPALAVEPDEPQPRCPVVADITPEAAATVLQGNPQGVLCYNDELAGWLESFDRYTAGGRPFWLSAYGGRSHSVTRKGSGTITIRFCGISVLGSVQPDKLVPLMAGANDGLIPRLVFAWPEKQEPRRPRGRIDRATLERAYQRLEMLQWGSDETGRQQPITLSLTDEAADVFEAWEKDNHRGAGDGGSLYETFAGKVGGLVVRLALLRELTGWAFGDGAEPASVSLTSLAAAINWCEEYAKPMAARVYGDAAVSEGDRNASLLARYIRRNRLDKVNMRELRRSPHKQHLKPLQAKDGIESAIAVLLDHNWLAPAFERDGANAGQPRKDFLVNPAVFGGGK